MLLLFWKVRAPSYAVAALSARPSATLTTSHGFLGAARARVTARTTVITIHNEVNAQAPARISAGAQTTVTSTRSTTSSQRVLVASRATSAVTTQRASLQQILVTRARASSLGSRASVANTAALWAYTELLPGITSAGHQGAGRMRVDARTALIGERRISPRVPMQQLTPIDLGTGYRGDTLILPVWAALTREGEPYDLENGVLRFTAKEDIVLPDMAPRVIQCSSLPGGGITILDPPLGNCYRVRIPSSETQELLNDTVFTFDVQLFTDTTNIYTIRRGLLTVVRDVTRAQG